MFQLPDVLVLADVPDVQFVLVPARCQLRSLSVLTQSAHLLLVSAKFDHHFPLPQVPVDYIFVS